MLCIYISTHCLGCATALRLAERVRAQRPDLPMTVVDIDTPTSTVPSNVIGTPIYTWNDRVLFLGNPSEAKLLERVGALHDDGC